MFTTPDILLQYILNMLISKVQYIKNPSYNLVGNKLYLFFDFFTFILGHFPHRGFCAMWFL